jgi:porin
MRARDAAAAFVLFSAALAPAPLLAQGLKPSLTDQAFGLTGDWDGDRTRLKDQGWTVQAGGTYELAGNPAGGRRKLSAGAGELHLGATADLQTLWGVPNAWLQVTLTRRFGTNFAPSAGLFPAMQLLEVYGRGDIWRLTDFWYEQQFAGGAVDLKLGRANPGEDFDAFPCDFQNLTFCGSVPGNIVGDYWFNHPISQWGGRLKAGNAQAYVEGGVYQVNPRNLAHGFDLSLGGGKGVLTPIEAGWSPKLGQAGLPGTWVVGGWWSSAKGEDVLRDAQGGIWRLTGAPPRQWDSRYGGYVSIQQQLTGTPKGTGLSVFANAAQADRRTALLDRQLALGVSYKGLIPSRAKDELALAVGWTHYNSRIPDAQALALARGLSSQAPQHTETAAELDYRFAPGKGVTLTPNLQVVHDVGGVRGKDATVVGLKAVLSL